MGQGHESRSLRPRLIDVPGLVTGARQPVTTPPLDAPREPLSRLAWYVCACLRVLAQHCGEGARNHNENHRSGPGFVSGASCCPVARPAPLGYRDACVARSAAGPLPRARGSWAALAVLLGPNGLRVSEACATNIEDLGIERGHRTLRILGKGSKPATSRSFLERRERSTESSANAVKARFCGGVTVSASTDERRIAGFDLLASGLASERCTLTCSEPPSSWRPLPPACPYATCSSRPATQTRAPPRFTTADGRTSTARPPTSWSPSSRAADATGRPRPLARASSPRGNRHFEDGHRRVNGSLGARVLGRSGTRTRSRTRRSVAVMVARSGASAPIDESGALS
jgi:hypothetical protein